MNKSEKMKDEFSSNFVNSILQRSVRKLFSLTSQFIFDNNSQSFAKVFALFVEAGQIILGDLRGIRENNDHKSKANPMIHNFRSLSYIIQRFKDRLRNME